MIFHKIFDIIYIYQGAVSLVKGWLAIAKQTTIEKKFFKKKIEKPLDKIKSLCYNKYVNKTKHSLKGKERIGTHYGKDDKCKGS